MSAAQLKELPAQQQQQQQGYEHLSKKTRIELVGAKNDHNYNQPAPETLLLPPTSKRLPIRESPQSPEPERAVEAIAGQMDDCMAAMVLMFLSTRPNEGGQPTKDDGSGSSSGRSKLPASNNNNNNGQRLPADGISVAAAEAAVAAAKG